MYFTCRSLIGNGDQKIWAQYWENEPDDLSLVKKRGHLFGLIHLSSPQPDLSLSQTGHQIIDSINQQYYADNNTPLFDHLKQCLGSVDSASALALAAIHQQQLYLSVSGPIAVILRRQQQISQLINGQSQQTLHLHGPLQPDDTLLFISQAFLHTVGWQNLKNILSSGSLKQIEEDLLSQLYSQDSQADLPAVLIQSHFEESDDSPSSSQSPPQPSPSQPFPISLPKPTLPKISLPRLSFARKPKSIYIPQVQVDQIKKRKKANIIVAISLLLALSLSSIIGFQKNQQAKKQQRFTQLVDDLSQKIDDAKAIKNLNLENSHTLALEAKQILTDIHSLELNQSTGQLQDFETQIDQILSQTGSTDNFQPQLFYQLSLIDKNPKFEQLFLSNQQLYLVDFSFGRIDILNLDPKSTKNISISDQIKQGRQITVTNDQVFLLTDTAVFQINKNSAPSRLDLSSLDSPPLSFGSFNGALYFLTSASILKSTPAGDTFSQPSNWLESDQTLSQPVSLSINGKIWVLSKSGQITPYLRGVEDSFSPSQQVKVDQAANLVVTPDEGLLAFTDSHSLIYVFQKDGQFRAKYNLGELTIHDIALDSDSSTLYVLASDQNIYQIKLDEI